MPNNSPVRPTSVLALLVAFAVGAGALAVPAWAQDPSPTTTTDPSVTLPPIGETTTTTAPPNALDPGAVEDQPEEPVPVVADTVPPRAVGPGVYAAQAGRILRQQLRVAKAEAITLQAAYATAKQHVVDLEAELDALETTVTGLAAGDRAAVRRV
ncbi:MAG: hypothetical protein ABIY48_01010, partial [Acidimicrobiales bacterium]